MALSRNTVGTPCTWSIGARGGTPDNYPARTIDRPRLANDARGRLAEVVNVIAVRKNLAGEEYTTQRLVNTMFLQDRNKRVELLDGTSAQPKSVVQLTEEHQARLAAFNLAQDSEMSIESLAGILAD